MLSSGEGERQKRHFMQGPPLIWICRANSHYGGHPQDAPYDTLRTLRTLYPGHYQLILAHVRACVFFGVSESSGGEGSKGQAMRASSATSHAVGEAVVTTTVPRVPYLAVWLAVAFSLPSSCPPRNGSLPQQQYIHPVHTYTQSVQQHLPASPSLHQQPPSPCWRAALLAAAERRKGTTYGFITDGRQGWRHARARCSLARLPAQ